MSDVFNIELEDNSEEILRRLAEAKTAILLKIGGKAVDYAQDLAPVGTSKSTGKKGYSGGTLKNSINRRVDGDVLSVGSDVEYAPYVELGTGPNFEPPPEWEEFEVPESKGIGHSYVTPRPFLRPAIEDHVDEYKQIAIDLLKKAPQ